MKGPTRKPAVWAPAEISQAKARHRIMGDDLFGEGGEWEAAAVGQVAVVLQRGGVCPSAGASAAEWMHTDCFEFVAGVFDRLRPGWTAAGTVAGGDCGGGAGAL